MGLIEFLLSLAVLGFLVWLITTYEAFKSAIVVVVVVVLVLWILRGVLSGRVHPFVAF